MKTLTDVRTTFLEFYKSKGHTIVPSAPLVPRNDPTLMFISAGMVPFKNVFVGQEKRPYSRATTAQKCVRAGGKHNDLENVGYTARHHTFFEMMGNFSFGDYFKQDAIPFAWELVTKYFDLPKDKLLVTVYHDDEEAAGLWKKVAGFSDDRIIRIKTDDNFWRMGDTGPCGPCSEIFIDQGPSLQGGPPGSPDEDGDRFLEFYNLVFMQYEDLPGGKRVPLPKPSIDTGLGLERTAAILQGVTSNYDTDLFKSLIGYTADLIKVDPAGPLKPSFRVIADHLRASVFLLADGVSPSNEGRGYVLRRIMRRAMRHAQKLGAKDPLMYRLVPELIKLMGSAYPEIARAEALATEALKLEETRFRDMLLRGLKLLEDETARLPQGTDLPGDVAFKLYDTYGFPADLTADILRGEGRTLDRSGFDSAMKAQKARARAAWTGSGEAADEKIWFELREELGATDFLGYDTENAEGIVTALLRDGARVTDAKHGDKILLLTNQTPFYAASGGQIGDTGKITTANAEIKITDTEKKLGSLFVHVGEVLKGTLKLGDAVVLTVDHDRRSMLRGNHSATHLLHAALRDVLGPHVAQKGSLVADDRLRFDFSHPKAIDAADLERVEKIVTSHILDNGDVQTRILTPDQAIAEGAMALFGEKYGDEVRVVSMGAQNPNDARIFSLELCGGTHVKRAGDIGFFKITSENAVSSGVRRIEAVTGLGARIWVNERLNALSQQLDEQQKTFSTEKKRLERELSDLRQKLATGGAGASDAGIKQVGNYRFLGRVIEGLPARDLKPTADAMKKQLGSGIVALIATEAGKASLVVGVTDDLTAQISAVDLVQAGALALGGKGGGGRPDMAQAGGPDANLAPAALSAIEQTLAQKQAA